MFILQFLVNGIISGAIISLVALGFSLIYRTNKFVHFAHGTIVAAGAYSAYALFEKAHWPFWIAASVAVFIAGVLGVLSYGVVYRPLKRRKASNAVLLIAGLALMILLENVILFLFGSEVKAVDVFDRSASLNIGSAIITPVQLVIIAASFMLCVLLWYLGEKTRYGTMLRAVSDNPELAELSGIPAAKFQSIGFLLGSLIAGITGVLLLVEQNAIPYMGTTLIILGFAGSVIGGVNSLFGAVLGSYIVGLASNLGIIFLPSGYREAITFVLLLCFLFFRPQGLFGIEKGTRE